MARIDTVLCNGCHCFSSLAECTMFEGEPYCPDCIEKITQTAQPATKETNPKDLLGIKKVPTFYIPTQPIFEEGLVMLHGAQKYGPFNWREKGVRFSVYYDACMRHLNAVKEGENRDPESGLLHLAHARACLGIIMDSMEIGNMVDDRPKVNSFNIGVLNEKAKSIMENSKCESSS